MTKKENKKLKEVRKPTATESVKDISLAQSSVNSQQRDALQKFREEFEVNKQRRLRAQLKEIDLL